MNLSRVPSPAILAAALTSPRAMTSVAWRGRTHRTSTCDRGKLIIDPVVLGGGKRFFSDDGALRSFRLVDSEVTSTGAILATYAPAG
jgi:hypothetical protein